MARRAVSVEMGAIRLSRDPEVDLVAFSLGSCVALCAWDDTTRLAAMAHVVLPTGQDVVAASGKYADQAVPTLMQMLQRAGGNPRRAQWKLAGGANVLRGAGLPPIGERNVQALRTALRAHGLSIAAEDTGGYSGRTVRLHTHDGTLSIRLVNGVERLL